MKKLSLYDLTYGYLKHYYKDPRPIDEGVKKCVMKDFKELLDEGWTAEEITKVIKENDGKPHALLKMNFSRTKAENLLKTSEFYWHPQLRITPGPPQRVVDYNTGSITKVEEEHFLEMRASYTLNDLLDYYCKQHGNIKDAQVNKYRGALKYVLDNHNIDTVLFMIDASANYIKAEDMMPLKSPLDIADYEREARHMLGEKITEEKQAGDDRVVPRRRVPLR